MTERKIQTGEVDILESDLTCQIYCQLKQAEKQDTSIKNLH
jgi:hypothetical protein